MKNILLILLVSSLNLIYSQNDYVHQVLILNEGYLDFSTDEIIEPVTVGVYSISSSAPIYNEIIEISDAKFASDLIINEGYFYVAADNRILKYNLNTYELIASQDVDGVRKLAIHDNHLFISKGDYDNETFGPVIFDSYLDVFDLDLNYQFSFDSENGPQWSTENLLINNNKLYVLINNAYEWGNYQGLIGVVDLNTLNYESEINLGNDAKNPINLMFKNDKLYTLNNKNWDGSSISAVDLNSLDVQTLTLSDVSAGCGVSIIRGEKLNYQKTGESDMNILDLETLTQTGVENNLNLNYYSISQNPITGNLFAATADFVTNSQIYVYDSNNNQITNFTSGVTTNKIVFDVRVESVSIQELPKDDDYSVIQVLDFLGRETDREGLYIEIYNNGFVNKQNRITK